MRLSKKEYYVHESIRAIIFVFVLWVLAQVLPTEYKEIYSGLVVILAIAQLVTLAIDYIFLWSKK